MSKEMTRIEFSALLEPMLPPERARAFVQANVWDWPDAFAEYKPDGWDALNQREKHNHPVMRELWAAIMGSTSNYDRSLCWWVEQLQRTKDEHDEWWKNGRGK